MRTLHVQLQPSLAPTLNISDVRILLESIASHPLVLNFNVMEGFDDGVYINFDYATENISSLWSELSLRIYIESPLAPLMRQASMVVCEGQRGWDDYLLLYHFDKAISLDHV